MSAKNMDTHNRWRNRTVAFRVSEEENQQINTFAKLAGTTKQDYITQRLLCQDVIVQGNPKVYKALKEQLEAVLSELKRINTGDSVSPDLLDTIHMIARIMEGMKEDGNGR